MILGMIRSQKLILEKSCAASDTINYLMFRFRFSDDWEQTEKWVHFRKGDERYDIKLDVNDEAVADLSAGCWEISLHGSVFAGDAVVRRITTAVEYFEVLSAGMQEGNPFPDPQPSELERMQAELASLRASIHPYALCVDENGCLSLR